MQSKALTDSFTVAAQIAPEDVPEIATQGYRSILCNRPDGEAPDQPTFAAIEAAAREAGLAAAYLPVISGGITAEDVADFRSALAELPQPVFAYCRSGTRCQNLWILSHQDKA